MLQVRTVGHNDGVDAQQRGLADTLMRYDERFARRVLDTIADELGIDDPARYGVERLRALLAQTRQTRRATELADASSSPLSTNEWKEEVFYSERLRALALELCKTLAPVIAISR